MIYLMAAIAILTLEMISDWWLVKNLFKKKKKGKNKNWIPSPSSFHVQCNIKLISSIYSKSWICS